MTVPTAGTGDEDGAVVIAVLGDAVLGPVIAGDAGEAELVVGGIGPVAAPDGVLILAEGVVGAVDGLLVCPG